MKILPWLLVVVFGVSAAAMFFKLQGRDVELATLRSQLATAQASPVSADQQGDPNDINEIERLRKENQEVFKLRNEVAKLQKQKQQLAQELQARANAPAPTFEQTSNQEVAVTDLPTEPEDPQTQLQREHANQCLQNMNAIEEAKTMWAVANNKQAGEAVTLADITTALPNNTLPICPDGGTYTLNQVGVPVTCSISGHSLLP